MIFQRDPCGIFCIVFTYGLILYADYVVISHIVMTTMTGSTWGALHSVLFNLLIFIQIFAHMRTVLSDPGTVPLPSNGLDFSDIHTQNAKQQEEKALTTEDWTVCQKCETYRPPRAHHCKICRRCIRRMDHHCPWVNNCIGEKNQKYFIQFLFYTGVLCAYALSLNIVSWVWVVNESSHSSFVKRQSTVAHSIALCVESLLFGLFVVAMLFDQMSSIFQDETGVEHVIHQKKKPRIPKPRKPKMALVREVFGHGPMYCWLFPWTANSKRKLASSSYDV